MTDRKKLRERFGFKIKTADAFEHGIGRVWIKVKVADAVLGAGPQMQVADAVLGGLNEPSVQPVPFVFLHKRHFPLDTLAALENQTTQQKPLIFSQIVFENQSSLSSFLSCL